MGSSARLPSCDLDAREGHHWALRAVTFGYKLTDMARILASLVLAKIGHRSGVVSGLDTIMNSDEHVRIPALQQLLGGPECFSKHIEIA
jgi:hypothetical protein